MRTKGWQPIRRSSFGGGSTGCGIARDLARRGLEVTLVERGTLTDRRPARHGLLHSGGRYAVSDRASARECIEKTRCFGRSRATVSRRPAACSSNDPRTRTTTSARNSRAVVSVGSPLACSRARKPARSNRTSRRTKRAIEVPDGAVDRSALRRERDRRRDPRRADRDPRAGGPLSRRRRHLRRRGAPR